MILYNIVKEQIAARQKKRIEQAHAEGLAEAEKSQKENRS